MDSPPATIFSTEGFNVFSVPTVQDLKLPTAIKVPKVENAEDNLVGSSDANRPQYPTRDSNGSMPDVTSYTQASTSQPQSTPSFDSSSQQRPQAQTLPPFDAPSPPTFAFSPSAFFNSVEAGPSSPYQVIASNPAFTSFREPSASLDASLNDFFGSSSTSTFDFDASDNFSGLFDGQLDGLDVSLTPFAEASNPFSTESPLASKVSTSPPTIAGFAPSSSSTVSKAAKPAGWWKLPAPNGMKHWWEDPDHHGGNPDQIRVAADPLSKHYKIQDVWAKIEDTKHNLADDDLDVSLVVVSSCLGSIAFVNEYILTMLLLCLCLVAALLGNEIQGQVWRRRSVERYLLLLLKLAADPNASLDVSDGAVLDHHQVQEILQGLPHRFECKSKPAETFPLH